MKLYGIVILVSAFLTVASAGAADVTGPVNYHIAFDDLAFLEDCWVSHSGLKTPEERKLEIVQGRFGNALYLGAVPLSYDGDNLSGIDLDMITAVIYNVKRVRSHNEPFIWGAGKLHPAYGSIAFWVKGPLRPDMLFYQSASSFGRLEKELLEIRLEDDGSISAYVEDTRYVRHTIRTKPVWQDDTWMHVVLLWDRSSGLSLWINGKEEASTMGTDAWWDNQRPCLFHFPMAKAAYDECYIFDRPLTYQEIARLYRSNTPPDPQQDIPSFDSAAVERMKKAFSTDISTLPVLKPSNGGALVFRQITPERIHDEGVSGWWLSDGRFECAWPHEYSIFTIVPGDADFHAEKADILPPVSARVNYVTFEGNLDGVTVLKGDRNGRFERTPLIAVPPGKGFFYGTMVNNPGNAELRIPFTKSWGTPPDFEGDEVHLPLSGDLRLHEVGLFNVSAQQLNPAAGDVKLYLDAQPVEMKGDTRYPGALTVLNPAYDRNNAGLHRNVRNDSATATLTVNPMTKLNLISEQFIGKSAYESVILDMWVKSPNDDNVLKIDFLNPAVPSHLWTHAEMRLQGFSGEFRRLRLALSFDPVFLVSGDRLWLQVCATDGLEIITGDPERPATVTPRPVIDMVQAEPVWSYKTMQPSIMTYSKMYEYMPWRITKRFPDVDAPESFNGPFDMAYPWQAVLKVNPGDRLANIYRELVTHGHNYNRFPVEEKPYSPELYTVPSNTPDWAAYFRKFQSYRDRIITWFRHHQRSDGQVGGGWNDDTLFPSSDHGREGGYSDMILDSNPDARILYNNMFNGFDRTNLFKGGYCRIIPMDRLHNGDFIRERYKSLIYNLGDPRSATWAMEEAWHLDKPEKTPMNYGDGSAFLFGKNVLEWYWGKKQVDEPYELKDRKVLINKLWQASEAFSDTTFWRFTGARVHTDDQSPYGSDIMHYLLNGSFGVREKEGGVYYTHVTITLGVGWIEGGGADLARLVEYSGNDGLRIQMYSFDTFVRTVTARLYRLDSGRYSITVRSDRDGDGRYESLVSENKQHLRRFGRLTVTVPPKISVILEVKQIEADSDPGDLPDLATSDYYVKKQGDSLTITVHNIGCAQSGPFTVTVLDTGERVLNTVNVKSVESPVDFVPKTVDVRISGLPSLDMYRIRIDSEDSIREIFEENNAVDFVVKSGE